MKESTQWILCMIFCLVIGGLGGIVGTGIYLKEDPADPEKVRQTNRSCEPPSKPAPWMDEPLNPNKKTGPIEL